MNKIVPVIAMIFSIVVFAYLGGILTAHYNAFPYPNIKDAYRTAGMLFNTHKDSVKKQDSKFFGEFIESIDLPNRQATIKRWVVLDSTKPRLPIIAYGGLNQYLEHCPALGCLAVIFNSDGSVDKTWPYRPNDIYATDITHGAYPHEFLTFDPHDHAYPVGIQRYKNDDLLVSFQGRGDGIFPFAMGVARIKPDGMPRWTRFDYSHHWPTLNSDGNSYVPTLKVGNKNISVDLGSGHRRITRTIPCKTDRPHMDGIQTINESGNVIDAIDLIPLFLKSNWAGLLLESPDPCDVLHLNYIDKIAENDASGLRAGDLVLSLRNLSSFIIFDASEKKIKRLVRGTFIQQHAVQHLYGSKFLIFDNHGGDLERPPSRLIELDIANGTERRVFPNADTPKEHMGGFSDTAGHLDISPDRTRVLVSFSHVGRAFEVEIKTGKLLSVYDNMHDISSVQEAAEEKRAKAARFSIYGMNYLR